MTPISSDDFPTILQALQTWQPRYLTTIPQAGLDQRRLAKAGEFRVVVKALGDAVEAGSIANTDYLDIKHVLNRSLEAAAESYQLDYDETPQLHNINAPRRRAGDKAPADLFYEAERLAGLMGDLAHRVVKKTDVQKAAKAEKARIAAAPTADKLAARAVFEDILAKMKDAFLARRRAYWNDLLDELQSLTPEDWTYRQLLRVWEARGPAYAAQHAHDAMMLLIRPGTGEPMVIAPDVEEVIEQRVQREVQDAFEGFLVKQSGKIDGILKGRAISRWDTKLYDDLEGAAHIYLHGGASFSMRFSFVLNTSSRGRHYWQFPTTFHDAITSTGERLKGPLSEALMKKALA